MQTEIRQQEMTAMPVRQIEATVIVGLLSKKCKGKGICSITLGSPEIHQKQCTYVPVLLSLVDGKLLLSFQKNQVKKCTPDNPPKTMSILKHMKVLSRLHALINKKSTGSPSVVAEKLNCSRATIYRYIEELKSYGAQITYSKKSNSFTYINPFVLDFNKLVHLEVDVPSQSVTIC